MPRSGRNRTTKVKKPTTVLKSDAVVRSEPSTVPWITVGTVVDTNDAQQMGRIRAVCPALGDRNNMKLTDIPWAQYVTPFGGTLVKGARGPDSIQSDGPVSYGMWAIPKIGAEVIIMCLDGNPSFRLWVGSIYNQFLTHTLPMGRWNKETGDGPFSSSEDFIQPTYDNSRTSFNNDIESFEWKTRIAEGQAAAVAGNVTDRLLSSSTPDEITNSDFRQGYQKNRIVPNYPHPNQAATGGANLDPQVYSITTPGQHTLIMDDSLKNGRVRIKTTSGNQIIMDDTNERMYITTPEGNNYIELDKAGNIDIYSTRRISVRAEKDINFTSRGSFRVSAESIHLRSQNDIRMHASGELNARAETDLTVHAANSSLYITAGKEMHLFSGDFTRITSGANLELSINDNTRLTTGNNLDFIAGGRFHAFSSKRMAFDNQAPDEEIHLNTGLAEPTTAEPAVQVNETSSPGNYAYTASRSPAHEPWGRISNSPSLTDQDKNNNEVGPVMGASSSVLELSYNDANVNKIDLGDDLGRNDNWRR